MGARERAVGWALCGVFVLASCRASAPETVEAAPGQEDGRRIFVNREAFGSAQEAGEADPLAPPPGSEPPDQRKLPQDMDAVDEADRALDEARRSAGLHEGFESGTGGSGRARQGCDPKEHPDQALDEDGCPKGEGPRR